MIMSTIHRMLDSYDDDGDDCGVGDSGCGDNDHNDGESCYYYAARATTMQPHDWSLCAAAAAWRRVRSDRSDRIQICKGVVLSPQPCSRPCPASLLFGSCATHLPSGNVKTREKSLSNRTVRRKNGEERGEGGNNSGVK